MVYDYLQIHKQINHELTKISELMPHNKNKIRKLYDQLIKLEDWMYQDELRKITEKTNRDEYERMIKTINNLQCQLNKI